MMKSSSRVVRDGKRMEDGAAPPLGKGLLQLAWGLLFMMGLGTVYAYSVFRPAVEERFGVGATLSGVPYMVALAFYALAMMATGRVLHRRAPRFFLLLGSALVASGWLLSSMATGMLSLTLTYGVLMGSGVGIAYGVPMAVVAKWFPKRRGLMVGMVLVGFGLSPVVTAPLARLLLEERGLPSTFRILGLAFGVILPLLALPMGNPKGVEASEAPKERAETVEATDLFRSRGFWLLYLSFVLGSMVGLMTVGITFSMALEWGGMDAVAAAGNMSVFALLNGAGRPLFGWMADRRGFLWAMRLSFGVMLLSAALLLAAGPGRPEVFRIAFGLLWMNLGAWLSMAPVATRQLFGATGHGQNYGVVFTAYGVGAVLGVLASGVVKDRFDAPSAVFLLVGGIALGGLLLSTVPFQRGPKEGMDKQTA